MQRPQSPKTGQVAETLPPTTQEGHSSSKHGINENTPLDDDPSPFTPATPTDHLQDLPEVAHSHDSIKPSAGMAEVASVRHNYIEFLFPSGGMAAIDLNTPLPHTTVKTRLPVDYISHITPCANMADSDHALTSSTTTAAEQDEIFAHGIINNNTQITKTFQADWGANIIIVNDRSLYTEFVPCSAALNPIDGVPIHGIKGYGTVIFKIGTRLVPVREVAFMPKSPQCTFTTSIYSDSIATYPESMQCTHPLK